MGNEINMRAANYRRLAGFNQSDFAEMLGMKLSTYSQCERKGAISAERLIKIADILNMDIDILLFGKTIRGIDSEPPKYYLTKNELKLIDIYRKLPKAKHKTLLQFAVDLILRKIRD